MIDMCTTTGRASGQAPLKLWLGAGCALAALVAAAPATAQTEDAGEADRITVTGTRIARTGMSTPTPVTVMSSEELETLSPGTLIDQLDALPLFTNSTSPENAGSWTTNGGQATLNMRGIGSQRTLVLLDGRRVAPSNLSSTVDINLFPQALIERTEVVTGGASAVYGSDAIAGVTNFILNDTFTGVEAGIQYGVSDEGDAQNTRIQLTAGRAFGERVHVVAGAEYYQRDAVENYFGRDWYQGWGDIAQGPSSAPNRLRLPNVTNRQFTFGGLIPSGPLAGTQFLEDGTPAPFENGLLDYSARTGGNVYRGSQSGGTGDDPTLHGLVSPEQERYSLFTRATVQLTDDIEFSLQGIHGYNYIENLKTGYVFYSPWGLSIQRDNAFLPESVRQQMIAAGVTSFPLHKQIPESSLLNNARAPLISRMYSVTAALDGRLSDDWGWSTYYQYGESSRDVRAYGYRVDRFFRGVDTVTNPATGEPMCRSTLVQPNDGCVPINPFGVGNETDAAREWVNGDYLWQKADITQHAAEVSMNGELIELPGGPVAIAFGASYRKDELDQVGGDPHGSPQAATVPDPTGLYRGMPVSYYNPTTDVGYGLIDRGSAPNLTGGFDVKEAFAETLIPLLVDQPFAQRLDLSLAARYADYEGSGGIWAWKVGGDWQVVDDFRFRVTRSRDIRAGSLSERFDITRTGANIIDPERDGEQYQVRTVVGGNPNIDPEVANTLTFGGVYQPGWLEGLALSVDYYDIKITDAIEQIGNQRIVDDCFDFNAFCDQIVRLPNGQIDVINNVYVNVAESQTRGIDIEASYRRDVSLFGGNESVTLRGIASHLLEFSETPYNSESVDRAGQAGTAVPWIVNATLTYRWNNLSVNWTEIFYAESERNTEWVEGVDVVDNHVPAQSQSNLRVNYDFTVAEKDLSVYTAVTNVFNKHPVRGLPGPYSNLGRSYVVGLRAAF